MAKTRCAGGDEHGMDGEESVPRTETASLIKRSTEKVSCASYNSICRRAGSWRFTAGGNLHPDMSLPPATNGGGGTLHHRYTIGSSILERSRNKRFPNPPGCWPNGKLHPHEPVQFMNIPRTF